MSLRKTAKLDVPHATFENTYGWTWKVLKTYKAPKSECNDRYARWFCFVTSPYCPEGEYGDTYACDVREEGRLVQATDEWREAYKS